MLPQLPPPPPAALCLYPRSRLTLASLSFASSARSLARRSSSISARLAYFLPPNSSSAALRLAASSSLSLSIATQCSSRASGAAHCLQNLPVHGTQSRRLGEPAEVMGQWDRIEDSAHQTPTSLMRVQKARQRRSAAASREAVSKAASGGRM